MLLVINTGSDTGIERAALKMMLERQVEGLIYATMYHREVALPALAEVPIVLLDCYVADRSLLSVVPDEVQGGRTATDLVGTRACRSTSFVLRPSSFAGSWTRTSANIFEKYWTAPCTLGIKPHWLN